MKKPRISALTWRILAVNALAPVLLVAGFFYMGDYEDRLIANEFQLLKSEAQLVSMALAESAAVLDYEENPALSTDLAANLVRRMVDASHARVRLYDLQFSPVADSRTLAEKKGFRVEIDELQASAEIPSGLKPALVQIFEWQQSLFRRARDYPLYQEDETRNGTQYPLVMNAMNGDVSSQMWKTEDGRLLLGVAVPVQRYKQVLGTIMLTRSGHSIDAGLSRVRADLTQIFLGVLAFTVLVSLYLAHTITGPVSQLANAVRDIPASAANVVTLGRLAQRSIPDLSPRGDELGDLSIALRGTTQALIQRLSAIEHFAADVAHELKNPLTSLRSAVETLQRVKDPKQLDKLLSIIRDDVDRLDRLISDTATASRLEAELSRAAMQPVQLQQLINTLIDLYTSSESADRARLELKSHVDPEWRIAALPSRLMQVFTNLVDNALSFSPPGKTVRLSLEKGDGQIFIMVDDDGPGIPPGKLEAIFDRFYSERPASEQYGRHSGLGLSIAKQIVEGHGGRLWAENRKDAEGHVLGARFTMQLPAIRA